MAIGKLTGSTRCRDKWYTFVFRGTDNYLHGDKFICKDKEEQAHMKSLYDKMGTQEHTDDNMCGALYWQVATSKSKSQYTNDETVTNQPAKYFKLHEEVFSVPVFEDLVKKTDKASSIITEVGEFSSDEGDDDEMGMEEEVLNDDEPQNEPDGGVDADSSADVIDAGEEHSKPTDQNKSRDEAHSYRWRQRYS
eukprot:gene5661-10899_t